VYISAQFFLRNEKSSQDVYSPPDSFDREVEGQLINGSWRREVNYSSLQSIQRVARRAPRVSEDIRYEFCEYFSSNGAVSWQEKLA
jgi:hypothetical protein